MDNKEKTSEIEDRKLGRKAIGPQCRQSNRDRNKIKVRKPKKIEMFENECKKEDRKRNHAKDKVTH